MTKTSSCEGSYIKIIIYQHPYVEFYRVGDPGQKRGDKFFGMVAWKRFCKIIHDGHDFAYERQEEIDLSIDILLKLFWLVGFIAPLRIHILNLKIT